ncbi:hypothetical protein [Streptomyces eurythermus]|uniref:hypothetical protein n=1 Tax=Streptomyces eurythermus TaxID=42237 RepID=UPI0036F56CE3
MTHTGVPARARGLIFVTAALSLALGACSASAGKRADPDGAARPTVGVQGLARALTLAPRTRQVLSEAETTLVERCMAKQGYEYFHEPMTIEAARSADDGRTRELHGDDVARARREGFAIPALKGKPSRTERQQDAYLGTLTPERRASWERALYGDPGQRKITVEVPDVGTMEAPTSGCFAQARTTLYGDYEKWVRADAFVNARFLPVNKAVRKQPPYVAVTRSWSACMRARGYRFADPAAAARSVGSSGGAAGTRVAVASAECDRKTGRSRTHRELFARQTLRWVEEHRAQAEDFRETTLKALTRADGLSDGSARR